MAARKSGLTPYVIRVWERRYGVVKPTRSPTNRRLYTEAEIERLSMLSRAVEAGYRIGNIATLDADSLQRLLATAPDSSRGVGLGGAVEDEKETTKNWVPGCVEAVRRMDAQALDRKLVQALLSLGQQGLLQRVVGPLAQTLGELWAEGSITAAHEHFASAFIKTFLGRSSRAFAYSDATPCVVVATPSGQLHELGAVMIAALAQNLGWRSVYLGAALPAAEIAGAAVQNHARVVALSLVYPADDPALERELTDLRRFTPSSARFIAGGRAVGAYGEVLDKIGAVQTENLAVFGTHLEALRQGGSRLR